MRNLTQRAGKLPARCAANVRTILPDAEIRKMVAESGLQLASGNTATKTFGKATLVIAYNKAGKEFTATITVKGNEQSSGARPAMGEKTGVTIAEFISQMRDFARQDWPKIGWLTFDPAKGSARTLARSEADFFKRFGKPIENVVDKNKADNSGKLKYAPYRERFRLWTYSCNDGTVTLHVEPTHIQPPSGQGDLLEVLDINIGPGDCVRK